MVPSGRGCKSLNHYNWDEDLQKSRGYEGKPYALKNLPQSYGAHLMERDSPCFCFNESHRSLIEDAKSSEVQRSSAGNAALQGSERGNRHMLLDQLRGHVTKSRPPSRLGTRLTKRRKGSRPKCEKRLKMQGQREGVF